ncbi:MAG: hypothetical protein L6407_05290 [Candidatus Delongbacteria bacterium]|nr:hypothetical protein [Candidatus Delongbacteria bacterium]
MNSIYLCYDVKGIQNFIFRIPKLSYIIGGSALIDRFDRTTIHGLKVSGAELLFSAGGKGAFLCDSADDADKLKSEIVRLGHEFGLEIKIGLGASFSEASNTSDMTYPFLPENFEGQPCEISGLYPVDSKNKEGIHKVVSLRNDSSIKTSFENDIIKRIGVFLNMEDIASFEFFHNVDPNDKKGKEGSKAIGGRNRWAVICMDGNDMGSQFRAYSELHNGKIDRNWLKEMSFSLDEITRNACADGILEVVKEWKKSINPDTKEKKIILPVRPLVVGGDDIIVLCHVNYAFDFVNVVCESFNKESKKINEIYKSKNKENIWVGTDGELTISSGIFFCPVSLPLHTAIPYAESLLSSAKSKGREQRSNDNSAAVSCIDWEQVTDGVVDTPAGKRQREFRFKDTNKNLVLELTQKPYTLNEFRELNEISMKYYNIPSTTRNSILSSIFSDSNSRLSFWSKLTKNHKDLADDLKEYPEFTGKWRKENPEKEFKVYSTPVIDALQLLEETKRMSYKTIL